jgi:hypothetical protein
VPYNDLLNVLKGFKMRTLAIIASGIAGLYVGFKIGKAFAEQTFEKSI